jgi:peptide chain release factor 2
MKVVSGLRNSVALLEGIGTRLVDASTALSLLEEDPDDVGLIEEAGRYLEEAHEELSKLEFQQKMSGELDDCSAFLEINAGGGGTDAQDWAAMLLRMYVRWAERQGMAVEHIDLQSAEVAGIKSATIRIEGEYAYGHLRSEKGVHRLVRISPFNANGKRQTSFASVSLTPDVERDIDVEVDEKDLRIDTYRSSGAGGQHVNKTDSAVRITHLPTGLVVACQNERSQHKNKDRAMSMLRSKLYELELERQKKEIEEVRGPQEKIDFGSQIRSYVLHPYRMVKDLRTNFETSDVEAVLDGKLDGFIEAFLYGGGS